jgi:putative transposase
LGLLLVVVVHAANVQESDGAKLVLRRALGRFPRLRLIWADQGYKDHFVAWPKAATGWIVEIVRKPPEQRGFVVLPRRWVVARSFAWAARFRRPRDYERLPETFAGLHFVVFACLMLHRLVITVVQSP